MNKIYFLSFFMATIIGCSGAADVINNYRPEISTNLTKVLLFQDVDEPDEPDEPVGPHPDADKCVCKGTGVITHGDGHTSPCPYHGKEEEPEPDVVVPDQSPPTEEECAECEAEPSVKRTTHQQRQPLFPRIRRWWGR